MNAVAPRIRFRAARERAGLSPTELASLSGVSDAGIWDIEDCDGDLTSCYSACDVQKFCRVLGIRAADLFGDSFSEPLVSPGELVRLIHEECHLRGVTLEQFEDAVGWRLSACIEPPEKLLEDITVDGLQWLCRELRMDWRRAI
ncbi:MAG TPA: helix-turn-helix transcriptional regulator [Verrucomicrobiae bacterium]|jgi:transcriptional regulator with XRE-family HTH domain